MVETNPLAHASQAPSPEEIAFVGREGRRLLSRRIDPLEAEPAYGYLLRLADRHKQASVRTFARELGLNVFTIRPVLCLAAVCGSVLATAADKATFARWTPDVRPQFSFVAGERIRRDDFTLRTRRYCPGCLAESPHHRVWFDLLFMNVCPLHGVEIVDRPDPSEIPAGWAHTAIDYLPSGARLSTGAPRLSTLAETLEGYTLRRFGLAPARPDDLLDPFPLSDVVEASELVGRLVIGKWRETMPLINSPGFEAPVLRREGWKVLGAGREALKTLFGAVAAAAPEHTFGVRYLFGWAKFNMYFKSDLAHVLLELMKAVATERGLNGRRYAESDGPQGDLLTVREVADILGANEQAISNVGHAFSLFEPHNGSKGTPLLMARGAIDRVRERLGAAIKRSEAAAYLRVPLEVFAEIVRAGHIAKYETSWEDRAILAARRAAHQAAKEADDADISRLWNGGAEDRFAVAALDAFLDRIPVKNTDGPREKNHETLMSPNIMTVARMLRHTRFDAGVFFRDVFDGILVVFARTGRAKGLEDFRLELRSQPPSHPFVHRWLSVTVTRQHMAMEEAVSQREACAMLDLNPPTVKVLCDLGHLAMVASKSRDDRFKLLRVSVEDFSRTWAAAKIYANLLDCQDAKVARRAAEAGVRTFFDLTHPGLDVGRVNGIYRRADMRRAFGFTQEPEETDIGRRGWKIVADVFGRERSLFACWMVRPAFRAEFSTADRLWPIEVSYVFGPDGRRAFSNKPRDQEQYDRIFDPDQNEGLAYFSIDAVFEVGGKTAAARIDDFEAKTKRKLPPGVIASVDRGIGALHARMRATFEVDDEGLPPDDLFMRSVSRDWPVILRMLNTIKCAFEDGPRPYDPAVFEYWPTVFLR